MSTAEKFFGSDDIAALKEAIIAAELKTSGEIKVYIESHCPTEAVERACMRFGELEMHNTSQRNGVLFYLAVNDRKFAIYGDSGIHAKVGADFWDSTKSCMESHFRSGRFTEGMLEGIAMAGEKLRTHFPYDNDDINELSDDIIFG